MNNHLFDFENTNFEVNQLFESISKDEDLDFILLNSDLPGDWDCVTEKSTVDEIIDSNGIHNLINKWNWKLATRKFDRESILEYLEEYNSFWDWEYVLNDVFLKKLI